MLSRTAQSDHKSVLARIQSVAARVARRHAQSDPEPVPASWWRNQQKVRCTKRATLISTMFSFIPDLI
jgi:hypothetical protein